jgi:hypothetical protein
MSATKVVLIVLVLIIVLFVVLAVWGAGINGKPTNDWHAFKADSHPAIGKLGDLFGPPGPRLKPGELTPDPPPLKRMHPGSATTPDKFILSAGDQPTKFDISPDSKDEFRQATFTVTRQGCATLEYGTADGSGGKLKDQNWPHDGEDPKNPTKAKFQVLSAKGFLRVTFLTSDCTLQME